MTTSKIHNEIVKFISDNILQNNNISVDDIYNRVSEKFFDINSDQLPIHFAEAYNIDIQIIGCAGSFWRSAYNFPKEGDIINIFGNICEVINVGIFTFDIIDYLLEKSDELDELNELDVLDVSILLLDESDELNELDVSDVSILQTDVSILQTDELIDRTIYNIVVSSTNNIVEQIIK